MIIRQCRRTIIRRNLVNKFSFLLSISFRIVRILRIMLISFVHSSSSVLQVTIQVKVSIKSLTILIAIRHSKISNVSRSRQTSLINSETRSIFSHYNRTVIFLLTLISTHIASISLIFSRIINRLSIATSLINNERTTRKIMIRKITTKKNIRELIKHKILKIRAMRRKHIKARTSRISRILSLAFSRKLVIIS